MDDPELTLTIHLVQAAQAGDQEAVNKLFERYLPRTRRIVAMRMGYRLKQFEELEDLVQDTLLKVFQGLERFEARTEASFRHWVAHCVECAIRDAVRHVGRKKRGGGNVRLFSDLGSESLSESIFAGKMPTPSKIFQATQLEEKIEASLLSLSDSYREIILLRSFCHMSYEEIATTMGFDKVGTARQAYSRAVQKLEGMLAAS